MDKVRGFDPRYSSSILGTLAYLGVIQLVECVIWDHDAAGSSPVTPMGEILPNTKKMPKM